MALWVAEAKRGTRSGLRWKLLGSNSSTKMAAALVFGYESGSGKRTREFSTPLAGMP
jgi:hypothetical protein